MKIIPFLLKPFLILGFISMLGAAVNAHAVVFCTINSTGIATAYPMTGGALNITSGNLRVFCINIAFRSVNVSYQIGADNGLNPLGIQNRATFAGSQLNYDLYTDPSCINQWQNTLAVNQVPNPPVTFTLGVFGSNVTNIPYYGCVPPGLIVPAMGTYTDTVTLTGSATVSRGGINFAAASMPVSITAPATCNFTQAPGNIGFNYVAFSATDVLASTTMQVTCTNLLPYSIALDTSSDVVSGLNYSLALNTTGLGGSNPLTSTGTGIAQTFFINGSMPAGQAGTCNSSAVPCAATQIRTLTVTY